MAKLMRALLLAMALAAGTAAAAEPAVTAQDFAEIRVVINRQLDAFRRQDAKSAFSLASPAVQQAFGTPERFLDAVRTSYRPMVRPASVTFLEPVVFGADTVQPVRLIEQSGAVWLAYYAMQRQKDGSWRANGCHLAQPVKTVPT
ncbi:MAG: DUF4864 domain-containing protein [Burkholderiales bacterium]